MQLISQLNGVPPSVLWACKIAFIGNLESDPRSGFWKPRPREAQSGEVSSTFLKLVSASYLPPIP